VKEKVVIPPWPTGWKGHSDKNCQIRPGMVVDYTCNPSHKGCRGLWSEVGLGKM
jgi:hypothetical protein